MVREKYDNYTREQLVKKIKQLEKHRYGLVWDDKHEEVAEMCERYLPVLHEETEKEIISNNKLTHNILIEGDNYHSLYTLNFTHKKKIDVIYIDPPYNTGNKDFLYNDRFVDNIDPYRHSKWLSFMNKRLRLAKNLLKDSGVILISIDDNEVAQLKLLCNRIFNESNFIGQLIVINNISGRSDKAHFAQTHEYVLAYQKSNKFKSKGVPLTEKQLSEYKYVDDKGKYRLQGLRKRGANSRREDRPNLFYKIYYDEFTNRLGLSAASFKKSKVIIPRLDDGSDGNWRWSKETFLKNVDKVLVKKVKERFDIFEKVYLGSDEDIKVTKLKTFIFDSEYTSDLATQALKEILPSTKFKAPKSVELIKLLLHVCTNKNSVILDFFAGSGTTGQSILELNSKDGGNRQFILCTNNENLICQKVTYPRIKKVINGYKLNKGIKANLRYYKTEFVPQVITDNDKRVLVNRATELLCLAENTFELVKQSTKKNGFSIFRNSTQLTSIIFDEDFIDNFKLELIKLDSKLKIIIYVFSYDHQYNIEDFEDLEFDFEVKPIPEVILNVYRKNTSLIKK